MNSHHGHVDVRNLPEACLLAGDYAAVLTVGPYPWEVSFIDHPNHEVFSFEDTENSQHHEAPTRALVEAAVTWGAAVNGDLLVHCHMGISRSTATAWGVLLARGNEPEQSLLSLKERHPLEPHGVPRPFEPNRLVVAYIEDILGLTGLVQLRDTLCC